MLWDLREPLIFYMLRKILISIIFFVFCFFSYYASTLFPVNAPRAVKRQRLSCTSPQSRAAGIISPQNQVVLQAGPQVQQLANGNLTTATNLLQLQQQQQIMLPVNLIQNQNYINNGFKLGKVDNNDCVDQQTPATGPFKVYSKLFFQLGEHCSIKLNFTTKTNLITSFILWTFHVNIFMFQQAIPTF